MMNDSSSSLFFVHFYIIFAIYTKYRHGRIVLTASTMVSVSTVCVIHFDEESGQAACFTEQAYQWVLECREVWKTQNDGKAKRSGKEHGIVWQLARFGSRYHRGCYLKFTNKILIDRARVRCEKARLTCSDDLSLLDKGKTETAGEHLKLIKIKTCASSCVHNL